MTTDGDPVIAKLARHARAAVGCVRQCKGRANMGQQHHVLMLSTAGRSILPGKIAALTDAKNLAETLDGELLLRRIDETEPHRLPSLAKKVAALFRISRSCRKISFSRRNRFSSAARSSCRSGGGASISCSRRLSSQRRSVERPTPRSMAISLCVRPLTLTNRTASALNSFPNRRCGLPMKRSSFLQKSSPLSQGKSRMAATLDGLVHETDAVFEAKFMLPWSFSEEAAAERHMAQLQHNMWVVNSKSAALSVITGGGKRVEITVHADALYQHFLLTCEKRFWRCVQTGEQPRPYGIEPPSPRIEAVRIVDMSESNSWAEFAGLYRTTRPAFLEHERAKAALKGLMPEDAKEATGHGVRAKRSKAGAVSFELLAGE